MAIETFTIFFRIYHRLTIISNNSSNCAKFQKFIEIQVGHLNYFYRCYKTLTISEISTTKEKDR